jgi:tight adherence protein C
MENLIFFVLAFGTLGALLWSAIELFQTREDPLAQRLDDLQSSSIGVAARAPRKRLSGNAVLLVLNLVPGAEGWIRDNEKLLNQAGIRGGAALPVYSAFHALFMIAVMGGMAWQQRGNSFFQILAGMGGAFLLGYMLPTQVLHRLVRRYRRRLQEALPDTVDLLGIVLGTGLAMDQAMLRVSEEMQYIYPELAGEFYTVVMQARAGQERSVAFQQLVRRTGVEDIKSLAAMIVQSEKFGTSLSQALKVYADALRTRRRGR